MNIRADNTQQSKSTPVAQQPSLKESGSEQELQLDNQRPEALTQRKLQEAGDNSPSVKQAKALQDIPKGSTQVKQLMAYQAMANKAVQRKDSLEEEALQGKFNPIQKKENNMGLPDDLKAGVEGLSGYSLDDVKVHYNSAKPAQLQAHAYAQDSEIHVAPGQEQHLPHEAWHVVQQKQGRVKPTMQMKGKVPVNDDAGLEKEADVMGAKALSAGLFTPITQPKAWAHGQNGIVQRVLMPGKLNVVGEDHEDSAYTPDRALEQQFANEVIGGDYWLEDKFPASPHEPDKPADSYLLRIKFDLATLKMYNDTLAKEKNPDKGTLADWCGHMISTCELITKSGEAAREVNETAAVTWYNKHEKNIEEISAILKLASRVGFSPAKEIGDILGVLGPIATRAEASMDRGSAMHVAAQHNAIAGVTGIWKIGQQHIKEITKTTDERDRVYTLTDMKAFDQNFSVWSKRKNAERERIEKEEREKKGKEESAAIDTEKETIDPRTGAARIVATVDDDEDPWADDSPQASPTSASGAGSMPGAAASSNVSSGATSTQTEEEAPPEHDFGAPITESTASAATASSSQTEEAPPPPEDEPPPEHDFSQD